MKQMKIRLGREICSQQKNHDFLSFVEILQIEPFKGC
jgi:hypothetical protein